MSRRAVALVAVSVVLAVAAVVLFVAGVDVRETTGGLLVTPIRQVHLGGGFLLAGTAAGVAAVLTALAAVPARTVAAQGGTPEARETERSGARPSGTEGPEEHPPDDSPGQPSEVDDAEHATTLPGSDRRS